jgi:hypothetical protein
MRLILPLLVLISFDAAIAAEKPAPSGLYGNVRMSAQTGDLGGQEIRFFTDATTGKPMVEFVDCEGWCNSTHTVPLMRDDSGYWFEYIAHYTDGDGTITDSITNRYRIRQKGRRIILTGTFSSCPDCDPLGPFTLKPLKQSFGIAVANNEP